MNVKKSKKVKQSELTRGTLLTVARALFTEKGYANTATEEIVQQAGVTRGALYRMPASRRFLTAARLHHSLGRSGIFGERCHWTNGAAHQFTTAVRAGSSQDGLGAGLAKRTFERAYHRLV
jgi:hypothetical protein